jgi:hypothetical protein
MIWTKDMMIRDCNGRRFGFTCVADDQKPGDMSE